MPGSSPGWGKETDRTKPLTGAGVNECVSVCASLCVHMFKCVLLSAIHLLEPVRVVDGLSQYSPGGFPF